MAYTKEFRAERRGLQSRFLHIFTVGTVLSKMQMACSSNAQCGARGCCLSSCEQDTPWTLHRVTDPNARLPRGLHPQGAGAAVGPRGQRGLQPGLRRNVWRAWREIPGGLSPSLVPFCVDRAQGTPGQPPCPSLLLLHAGGSSHTPSREQLPGPPWSSH